MSPVFRMRWVHPRRDMHFAFLDDHRLVPAEIPAEFTSCAIPDGGQARLVGTLGMLANAGERRSPDDPVRIDRRGFSAR